VLNVSNNEVGADGVAVLCSALGSNTALTEIDLKQNQVGNSGIAPLANLLASPDCALARVGLQRNSIDCTGAIALASTLRRNRSVSALDLRFNEVRDAGACAIASALDGSSGGSGGGGPSTVTELDLGGNHIGPEGGQAIAKALM
jgi:Ran GTPase-activating protein (RanGAP) involved in mRNA processing and transport